MASEKPTWPGEMGRNNSRNAYKNIDYSEIIPQIPWEPNHLVPCSGNNLKYINILIIKTPYIFCHLVLYCGHITLVQVHFEESGAI